MAYDAMDTSKDEAYSGPRKPFWALDFDNEEELLKWCKEERDYLREKSREKIGVQRKNLAAYRGIQLTTTDAKTREEAADRNGPKRKARNPRVVYNHMVDLVEQRVARAIKYRGAVACKPPNEDDKDDRVTATVGEELVEQFWEKSEYDFMFQKHERRKAIFGDDYIGTFWNKNLGPYCRRWLQSVINAKGLKLDAKKLTPAEITKLFRKELRDIPRLPVVDPVTGEQMLGADGDPLWIDRPQRRGDIEYRLIPSMSMLTQRKPVYDGPQGVEYGMFPELCHPDVLRADHPAKAKDIEGKGSKAYDNESCEDEELADQVEAWHLFHRSTDQLDRGRYVKFTETAILVNIENPYVGWDDLRVLPWVRGVDIDSPLVPSGDAYVTYGRSALAVYNNLVSMDVRAMFNFAHPKWFMPKGASKPESLANQSTLVQYRGPMPPKLEKFEPVSQSSEVVKERAKNDMQQIMGTYGVSRGEPPAGVVANVALQFLDEQEEQRDAPGTAHITRTHREVALRTIWLMADYYADDEGRLEELLGKTRAYQAETFRMANLRNIADLSIQNASALPRTKAAKTQYLLDVKEKWPGIIPDELAVDLLGFGETKRFMNIVTVAIKKADSENMMLLNGKEPPAPGPQEYHIAHYRSHLRQMNEEFYNGLPEEDQKKHVDHIRAHEMFMCQIALLNPPFMMKIMQEFPSFPVYYKGEEAVALAQRLLAMSAPPPAPGGAPGALPPPTGPAQEPPMAPGMEAGAPGPQGMPPGAESFAV